MQRLGGISECREQYTLWRAGGTLTGEVLALPLAEFGALFALDVCGRR